VSLAFEPLIKFYHLFVDHHFPNNNFFEFPQFNLGGQHSVEKQVASLHVGGVFGQLLDRVTSIKKLSLLAVDVADVGDAAGCAHEAWIVGEEVGLGEERADIDEIRTQRSLEDRKFILLVADLKDSLFFFLFGLSRFDR
jgi:hypothetical protein